MQKAIIFPKKSKTVAEFAITILSQEWLKQLSSFSSQTLQNYASKNCEIKRMVGKKFNKNYLNGSEY